MRLMTGIVGIGAIALIAIGGCSNTNKPVASSCKAATPDAQITIPIAPRSQRVDLADPPPTFSNPTSITNPLFPVSGVVQTILVGTKDGLPFRAEYTLLPDTRTIASGLAPDQEVENRTVHYLAYLNGRITELALDWYAQDDAGTVWYFGEDVFNYEAGVVVDNDGTWLACQDGPAAMIMPATPLVGNVWRPENIFGNVFEEVTVSAIDQTMAGPGGNVTGVLVTSQLYQDGSREDKLFAPGYGEFSTGSPGADLEALALAVPTDALSGSTPVELETVVTGAAHVFDRAQSGDWGAASTALNQITSAWNIYRAGGVPPLLDPLMTGALDRLAQAITTQASPAARQAALDVSQTGLDLKMRYRPVPEIDLDRLDLWARQLTLDVDTGDAGGMASDVEILAQIWSRVAHAVPLAAASQITTQLGRLKLGAGQADRSAAHEAARDLRMVLRGPLSGGAGATGESGKP